MSKRMLILLAIAAATSLTCIFSYDNPAEKLEPGEVRGRVVAAREGSAALVPVPDAGIRIVGVGYICQSKSDGRFAIFDLPPGTYQVGVEDDSSSTPRRAMVSVTLSDANDAVDLGDLVVAYGATIQGKVLHPDGTPAPGAQVVDPAASALAFTDQTGTYQLPASAPGVHELSASTKLPVEGTLVAGPVKVEVKAQDERKTVTAGPMTLHASTGLGTVQAPVRFLIQGKKAPPTPAELQATLWGQDQATTTLARPGSDDVIRDQVPAGLYYSLDVTASGWSGGTMQPGSAGPIVIVDGKVTEVGPIFLVDQDWLDAEAQAQGESPDGGSEDAGVPPRTCSCTSDGGVVTGVNIERDGGCATWGGPDCDALDSIYCESYCGQPGNSTDAGFDGCFTACDSTFEGHPFTAGQDFEVHEAGFDCSATIVCP